MVTNLELYRKNVSLITYLIALAIVVGGGVFLYLSSFESWWQHRRVYQILLQQIGGLLFVTASLTFLWNIWGERAFADEILAKAQIAQSIVSAGIVNVTNSFHDITDWESFFSNTNKIDIFFTYARTWRNSHRHELQSFLSRNNVQIRVVLPDPDDNTTIDELARRFSQDPDELKRLIEEAEEDFRNLGSSASGSGTQVSIWYLPTTPVFTFYLFDQKAILALYTHRPEQAQVPTFVCEANGTLYDFIRQDFDKMVASNGQARRVV